MGLTIYKGASYFKMSRPPNQYYGCHQFAEYKNATGSAKILKSVTLYLGSGAGHFTTGADVTGAGGSFGLTVYVGTSASKTSTKATVTVNNNIAPTGVFKEKAIAYTFNFANPVTVNANSTVDLWWWCEDTTNTKVLILDYDRGSVQESSPITTYTVEFKLAGGTRTGGGELVQTVKSGENATPPTCKRTGYTFKGWDGIYTNVTSNRTITAIWEVITYTITYNSNGGSGTSHAPQTKQYGVDVEIKSATLFKNFSVNYDANGGSVSPTSKFVQVDAYKWNTKSDGTGTDYLYGQTYSNNADLTLYAI